MPQQDQPQEKRPLKGRAERGKAIALKAFIQRRLPSEPTSETLLAAHERALEMLWNQLVPLMGHSAVRAIFAQAIQTAKRRQPLSGQARALETSLDFSALRAQSSQSELAALDAALMVLACNVEKVIVGLIGIDLFLSLLGDVELELLRQEPDPPA